MGLTYVTMEVGDKNELFWTPLGKSWYQVFYRGIVDSLHFDSQADKRSAQIMSSQLSAGNWSADLTRAEKMIAGKTAIVFGAGPSIGKDLEGLKEFIVRGKPPVVAADGAADALVEHGILPGIIVTDLDSCSEETLRLVSREGSVFAHAHGDNISLVESIIPKLSGGSVFGTCQSAPEFAVRNFGGFTDGDRACYVTCFFSPNKIIIGGMDFDGLEEGSYSASRYQQHKRLDKMNSEKMILKFAWGKKSLEFLINKTSPGIQFWNATNSKPEIKGCVPKVYTQVEQESKGSA